MSSPLVLIQYVIIKQPLYTQHFIIVNKKLHVSASCTRQPSSGFTFPNISVNNVHGGSKGRYVVSGVPTLLVCVCVPLKPETYHLFLPSPMHARPRHDPWKSLWTAKPLKSETRVLDAIIVTNQLSEITPTENPRSSKVARVENKDSNLVL